MATLNSQRVNLPKAITWGELSLQASQALKAKVDAGGDADPLVELTLDERETQHFLAVAASILETNAENVLVGGLLQAAECSGAKSGLPVKVSMGTPEQHQDNFGEMTFHFRPKAEARAQ